MSLSESEVTQAFHQLPLVNEDMYDDGYLRIELDGYYVVCGGTLVRLPRTEFLILWRLSRAPGRIVTSDEIWRCAWKGEKPLNAESLHVYIYRLRQQLVPYKLRIETMVNVGYRLLIDGNQTVNT
jgi:DNA-binding response OmpR family regulator